MKENKDIISMKFVILIASRGLQGTDRGENTQVDSTRQEWTVISAIVIPLLCFVT